MENNFVLQVFSGFGAYYVIGFSADSRKSVNLSRQPQGFCIAKTERLDALTRKARTGHLLREAGKKVPEGDFSIHIVKSSISLLEHLKIILFYRFFPKVRQRLSKTYSKFINFFVGTIENYFVLQVFKQGPIEVVKKH